jgi:hypothetical protein
LRAITKACQQVSILGTPSNMRDPVMSDVNLTRTKSTSIMIGSNIFQAMTFFLLVFSFIVIGINVTDTASI